MMSRNLKKVRIYHHEQHQKQVKKSSILKLDTEAGVLLGNEACSAYLVGQVAELLEHEAVLDHNAQAILLAEVTPVFTDLDNKNLLKLPDKDEVKFILDNSNLHAAPGTDGITSFLLWIYFEHIRALQLIVQ